MSASFVGVWRGSLRVGSVALRLQLHLEPEGGDDAQLVGRIDSLDQGATGIACAQIHAVRSALSLRVPAIDGHLHGSLAADGRTVEAIWSQAASVLPLTLHRRDSAIGLTGQVDPALPPVALGELDAVLQRDLGEAFAGVLGPGKGIGATVGVLLRGARFIRSYGEVKDDSIFEIGSITKTFTGLLLAQMVAQGKARLDEPVRALLPPGTVSAPDSGDEISLLDLSTHRSGLPRLPGNFAPADAGDPYVDYDEQALYAYLAEHGVGRPAQPQPAYSNLGVGLLGHALAQRAGLTFDQLVEREITGPLAMHDTAGALTPAQQARFVTGHGTYLQKVRPWDQNVLAGAGSLRSTAADMLTYLEAQLHPGRAPSLAAAIAASHEVHGKMAPSIAAALGWAFHEPTKTFAHGGGTGGFNALACFDPAHDLAVVALCNLTPAKGELADRLARHVRSRILGEPAIAIIAPPLADDD